MKNKLLKILAIIIFAMMIYLPSCYATGATIKADKTEVKAGDTVELYIELSTVSIGYDIKIDVSDNSIISSSELISKIGEGNASRIYLVQLASSSERQKYQSGTKIATIKYKISDTAEEGSTVVISASGDVAGENSSDKNTVSESVTLKVVGNTNNGDNNNGTDDKDKNTEDEGNKNSEEEKEQDGKNQEEKGNGANNDGNIKENSGSSGSGNSTSSVTSSNTTKDTTTAKSILPRTGSANFILVIVFILTIISIVIFAKYNNSNK